jgi:hypothetical protein
VEDDLDGDGASSRRPRGTGSEAVHGHCQGVTTLFSFFLFFQFII